MVLPLLITVLTTFAGILIPNQALTAFWRYWLYYLDPFTYLMQGPITFPIWNADVECKPHEYGLFDPPASMTCVEYLEGFMKYAIGYLNNLQATAGCQYCGYKTGYEYIRSMEIHGKMDGWKGILVTLMSVVLSYALVFLLLKLRSKKTKTAS